MTNLETVPDKKIKKKKKKPKSDKVVEEIKLHASETNSIEDNNVKDNIELKGVTKLKKKKGKKQKEELKENKQEIGSEPVKTKKKRKKNNENLNVDDVEQTKITEESNNNDIEEENKTFIKKKSKKQKKLNQANEELPLTENKSKKKKKRKLELGDHVVSEEILEDPPTKKAKKIKERVHGNTTPDTKPKKKKKSKNNSALNDAKVTNLNVEPKVEQSPVKKKSKKKKRKQDVSIAQTDEANHLEAKEPVLSSKTKEETKITEVQSTQQDTKQKSLGQWTSGSLESSERENKFFRLLGGMKKQNANLGSNKFSKLAMSFSQSKKMDDALEEQYNNTLAFNLKKRTENNKSKGLGFVEDPAKGKKFHIDVNKSQSVKFDD